MIGDLLPPVNIDTPANRLGCRYALLPERALALPPGQLMLLALAASLRRRTCWLELGVSDAIRSVGYCGKTFHAHWYALAAAGWMRADRFAVASNALVRPGDRYARVRVDRLTLTGAAAFKLYAVMRLYTARNGALHASRERLARDMDRSTRTVRRLLNQLRLLGYAVAKRVLVYAEKTVRSTRKGLSAPSPNGSRHGAITRSLKCAVQSADAFERARDLARAKLAAWVRGDPCPASGKSSC